MKKRISTLLIVILLITTLFSGCGAKKEEVVASDETTTEVENNSVVVKNSLKIAHHGEVPSLDTHNALNDNAMRVMTNIYDPLVRMDKNFKIIPSVAERWDISEDGTEYTFYIKPGIKFQNGDELKLSDVIFSIQRGMESPQASPSFSRVIAVEAVGDNAVKIKLSGPYNGILTSLALPVAGILSEKVVTEEGEDFGRNPIGTGPYKLLEWNSGGKVVLEAFEDYHEGAPSIKQVEFITITDTSAGIISLEKGDIDLFVDASSNDFKRIEESTELELHLGESFGYYNLAMNVTKPPFDNVKVRQAMAYATDKESILIGILNNVGVVIDTFAIDKMLGYTDEIKKYPYDLEKAKKLLVEAGYPDGFETDIYVGNELASKMAQVMQNSLSQVGVKVNVKLLERAALEVASAGGEATFLVDGSTFAAPNVDDAIYDSVHSSGIGLRNYAIYKNKEMDELLDKARLTVDEEEIQKLYEKVLIKISEDVPIIPIAWRYSNVAANKNLKNVNANPYSFYYVYDFSW